MHTRTLLTATLLTVSLAATGCGLLETNDDEMETLRVEIIQLREDFMDLEAEVSLLARVPATTTTSASSSATTTAASAARATTTTSASSAGAPAEEDQASVPTVPVGLNEEAILTATYEWGPSDPAVILQELLGVTADGWYGNGTRAAHVAELGARGLSVDGVPSPPTTTAATEAPAETTEAPAETTEAPAETTEAPAETTEAPAETTEAPAETTEAPAETTEAPAETTTTAAG